ncbi:MAG: TIGR03067 domain-containing protein [Terriglobia bacterium]
MYADTTQARTAEELERFQGTWVQVTCQIDGVKDPPEVYGLHPRVTFSGRKYVVTRPDGALAIRGHFKIDPMALPKSIDWTDTFGSDAGITIPAIYFFEQDRFVFCAASASHLRPCTFNGEVGHIVRIHERVKP